MVTNLLAMYSVFVITSLGTIIVGFDHFSLSTKPERWWTLILRTCGGFVGVFGFIGCMFFAAAVDDNPKISGYPWLILTLASATALCIVILRWRDWKQTQRPIARRLPTEDRIRILPNEQYDPETRSGAYLACYRGQHYAISYGYDCSGVTEQHDCDASCHWPSSDEGRDGGQRTLEFIQAWHATR